MDAAARVMSLLEQGIPLTLLLDLAGAGVSSEELLFCEVGDSDLAELELTGLTGLTELTELAYS